MSTPRRPLVGRLPRPERLLPVACIVAAGALFASEFMTTFELTPPGGQALCSQQAADRHHYALAVLAVFAIGAVLAAVLGASKPAAISVAVAGLLALLVFLIADLPKANNVGTLAGCSPSTTGSFFEAKALPQAGFWLEMVGALALALSGAALATLAPEQLDTLRPRWLAGSTRRAGEPGGPGLASPSAAGGNPRGEADAVAEHDPERPADRPARARDIRPR